MNHLGEVRASWVVLCVVMSLVLGTGCGGDDSGGGADNNGANAGQPDQGAPDAGAEDTGDPNAGQPDMADPDQGQPDMEDPDAGGPDVDEPDTGAPDMDEPDMEGPDTGRPDVDDPSAFLDDIPVLFSEGDTDRPDCIGGCTNENDPSSGFFMLMVGDEGGISGTLDDGVHRYSYQGGMVDGADVDIIALQAPPRANVDLWLTPSEGSQLRPLIYVLDLFKTITFNGNAGWGQPGAHTELVFPYLGSLPILVVVEDSRNYEGFPEGPFVGGADLGYELRWSISDFDAEDLGVLGAEPLTAQGQIAAFGDMNVYRFEGAEGATPSVTVTPAEGSAERFGMVVSTMTSAQGTAEYGRVDCLDPGMGTTLDWSDETIGDNEFLFVVYDCDGRGGDDYNYTLTITP